MPFNKIFALKNLFDATPIPETKWYILFGILFLIMILASVAIAVMPKKEKKLAQRFYYPSLIFGILGLLSLGANYESLPWLGAKATIVGSFAGYIVWMIVAGILTLRVLPKVKKERAAEDRYKKYLPESKLKVKSQKL